MEKEFLIVPFEIEETKEHNKDGKKFGVIKGYASTFGNIDSGQDRIIKGAFEDTLRQYSEKGRQVRMNSQHSDLIGGFPVFKENRKGLYVEGNINLDVQKGIEAYSLAKQGVLTDMSIGYLATDVEFVTEKIGEKDGNNINMEIRNIKKLDLWEVSIVSEPMNIMANITAIKSCKSITDMSKFLKSKGLTNKETNEIIYFIKTLDRNDSKEGIKDSRNEIFEKIDSIKTINYISKIIQNTTRRS